MKSQCPAGSCGAADSKQRALTEGEIDRIKKVEDANWLYGAMICTYCTCVYSIGSVGNKVVRGFFENDQWVPSGHA